MNVAKLALFFTGANQNHLPLPPPAGAGPQQHEAAPSGKPAVLSVQGRLYPVQEHFLKVRHHAHRTWSRRRTPVHSI